MTDQDRIEATARLLLAAVREAGAWISGDGRVSEETGAELLGLAPKTLRNMRSLLEGPPPYRIGGNGCRVTYRVADLAAWIESRREW